jgi:hypothetical protein
MAVKLLQGRKHTRCAQARGILLLLPVALPIAGCAVPPQLNPATLWREVSGANFESRIAPPGLDQPSGNLGMVPARPDRPDPATRMSLDNALLADRAQSREPLALRTTGPSRFTAPAPGTPLLPAAPPPPPALARAAPIPWTSPPVIAPGAAAPEPGQVPALPTPDLLGPPGTPPPPPPSLN